jgi:dihydrodipicolinate synthase/N-acetylneuraminate lyase
VIPQSYVALFKSFNSGDYAAAEQKMSEITDVLNAIYSPKAGAQAGVKAGLAAKGLCEPYCRKPLEALSEQETHLIKETLTRH